MVSGRYVPEAGDVIKIDMEPRAGHEQGGWRPAVVLSPKAYNAKTSLAVLVPVTSEMKGYPFEVRLPPEMKTHGVVLADAIKNLDWRVRRAKFVETASPDVISAVHCRLVAFLGLAKS